MTEQEIHKLLEIQYLKGRIDELHKAIPTVTSLERQRKLDQRLDKYYQKLKATDEIAYHLYQVETSNRHHSKRKDIAEIQDLLQDAYDHVEDSLVKIRISEQLHRYTK
jgi:predicted  nucleic acid-binding Zn-ribbon protein